MRPYKKAWKSADALDYLRAQRAKHFDPRLVDAFIGVSESVLEVQRDMQDAAKEGAAT
ncbi:Cyclic di-GMP phosphodiesterase response regulator RpfG [compost metagenome]